jgi:hypothetical protein
MNLGFGNHFPAEVFVIAPSSKDRRFVGGNISGLDGLKELLVPAVAASLMSFAGYRWSLGPVFYTWVFGAFGAMCILAIVWLLCRRAYEVVFPPQVVRCRSCQRRMRTASDWRRYVWLVERESFCISDCLTALKQDHWDDAVTLFLVHTTEERLDTWSKLIFLECKSCLDQRAYFWFPTRVGAEFAPSWSEAYKFFDSRKAEEFAKAEKLRTRPTHPMSTENAIDFHDQVTM